MKPHILASAFLVASVTAVAGAQSTITQSTDSMGLVGVGQSLDARISGDGRVVVFSSAVATFAPDANASPDVFVRDRQTGEIELVSAAFSSAQTGNGTSIEARVTPDGRFVVFTSGSSNLVANDGNGLVRDVFVRDRVLAATEVASLGSTGIAANSDCLGGSISDDGRYVAFWSPATNLVPGDTNAHSDVYVRDRVAGTTVRVSISTAGTQSAGDCRIATISGNGRFVAFMALADDLVIGDSNGFEDILLRDLVLSTTEVVSLSSIGAASNDHSSDPAISVDGRYVAFQSFASNLAPNDGNASPDVLVRDRTLGTTTLESVDGLGNAGSGPSFNPSLSRDGRWLAFESNAILVAGDVDSTTDVHLRDRLSGTTKRVSVGNQGEELFAICSRGVCSDDGRYVAFDTAGQFESSDTNGLFDVYLRDTQSTAMPALVYCTAKVASAGCTPNIGVNGTPQLTGFDSFFVVAHDVLMQKNGLLFWGSAPASLPFGGGTLCAQPPLVRTDVQNSGATSSCSGAYSFHFTQAYFASENVLAGDTLYAQYWYRDNGFAPPNNVGLSDAVSFTVGP